MKTVLYDCFVMFLGKHSVVPRWVGYLDGEDGALTDEEKGKATAAMLLFSKAFPAMSLPASQYPHGSVAFCAAIEISKEEKRIKIRLPRDKEAGLETHLENVRIFVEAISL